MKNERLRMTRSALPYSVLLFCLAQFFSSCKPGRPSGILSSKEMEDVLVDYHLAKGMAECQDRDRDKFLYLYVRAALSKHGVTEARFDSSLVWYSRHSEQMADIYKSVMKRIETQANIHGISEPTGDDNPFRNLTSEGDTADVWADKRSSRFCPKGSIAYTGSACRRILRSWKAIPSSGTSRCTRFPPSMPLPLRHKPCSAWNTPTTA